ncbi:MAG TPA: protein-glutamate O-methyltransferase CheR [Spirochaetia bacterium]|nr:protein-glutamate O-methyltransferase CheR [Spirochaetia bacterium]
MDKKDRKAVEALLGYTHHRLGFRPSAHNRAKLETKLGSLGLGARWPDLETFVRDLDAGDAEARDLLVKTITVNHTFFFREPDQIEALAASVKSRGIAEPKIWSAASSTGEEAYSLAIHLLEKGITSFRLVASDVNPRVLSQVDRGIYQENRLEKVPRHLRLKYFTRTEEGGWQVVPDLRQRVAVKRVNLLDPVRFHEPFDYIFCRNVFIYFDEASRLQVLGTLAANLKVGGTLYLGVTEALLEVPPQFVMESHATYRRVADTGRR